MSSYTQIVGLKIATVTEPPSGDNSDLVASVNGRTDTWI